jgi:ribose transport system permease protein
MGLSRIGEFDMLNRVTHAVADNPTVFTTSILLALWAILSQLSPYFFTLSNLLEISVQAAVFALIGVGQTFVILAKGIDLSVGSILAASAVSSALVMDAGYGITLGVVAGLLCGAIFGAANGVAVGILRIPPFVATLGMMGIARGYALIITGGIPVFKFASGFELLGQGRLFDVIPVPTITTIVLYAIGFFILMRTKLGRYTFSIGSSFQATTFSGVNVSRYLILIYTLSGVTAAIAGLTEASRIGSGQPAAGMGYELDSIAAVVIGGTSLFGGQGSLFGTWVGALIIATIRNGLNILGVYAFWQLVAIGGILIGAVYVDSWRRRRRGGQDPT